MEIEAYEHLGLTPHELYEFTPQEYTNMMKGSMKAKESSYRDLQYQAWYNASFVGMMLGGTKLPPLEEIMGVKDSNKLDTQNKKLDNKSLIELALKRGLKVPKEIIETVLQD